ncbi:PREDICTED: FAR1-RELATED SEQUENCE 3 [Prunus dulcis]|uniref:PREDICTED: FAR1-RELATED SEQUENCE 3 n=2 Tax=Prunus dulcis TaxID=3755 RepID=A0A5E4FPN0_PRUDU|nr:hypothetical protein L3X38_036921 [Prunus dulcis]VVA29421.1 PREDICTED: FAR1-RELATED SEQUENCE 3 [Prunus dulcis]
MSCLFFYSEQQPQEPNRTNEKRMEVMEDTLHLQLHKLSALKSEEALDQLLCTLWKTRKTGLHSPHQKSHFQSLLNLPSLSQLHPVLACLRSLIRKWVHENFTGDDLLKLFPPDLPLDLQSSLVVLFHKYQSQWKDEVAREQLRSLPRTSVSYQVKTSVPPSFTTLGSSCSFSDFGASSTPIVTGTNASRLTPMSPPILQVGTLPRLKSMTWTMENCNSGPANRVAVINLKLQDYTKSPLDEIEVKFQLTRDTLEAMLRSLTYIKEQLSSMVGTISGPSQKKQKQSDHLV